MGSSYNEKLEELRKLEDGWDSYNAPKPHEIAFKNVNTLLDVCRKLRVYPDKILPSVEGGVALLFLFYTGYYIEIECDNEGDIFQCICFPDQEPEITIVFKENLENVLKDIKEETKAHFKLAKEIIDSWPEWKKDIANRKN